MLCDDISSQSYLWGLQSTLLYLQDQWNCTSHVRYFEYGTTDRKATLMYFAHLYALLECYWGITFVLMLSRLWLASHSLHRYSHPSLFNLVFPPLYLTSSISSLLPPPLFPPDRQLCGVALVVVPLLRAGGLHRSTEVVSFLNKIEFWWR
jgi:hypothetical protein